MEASRSRSEKLSDSRSPYIFLYADRISRLSNVKSDGLQIDLTVLSSTCVFESENVQGRATVCNLGRKHSQSMCTIHEGTPTQKNALALLAYADRTHVGPRSKMQS